MPFFDDEEKKPFEFSDPKVKDFIMQKYSPEARQKLVSQNEQDSSGPNFLGALAALGTGLQGGNAAEAGQNFVKNQQAGRDKRLSEFDSGRKLALEEETLGRDREKLAREMDPNSDDSKLAQQMAIDMGVNPELASKLTAAKLKEQMPFLEKKYAAEQRRLDRAESREDRRLAQGLRQDALDEKKSEKIQALQTPYGIANSLDDAKQLKEAHESKKSFDSKIDEMIKLRKDYGGEVLNREAVARGKQLSKDLLLEYKNMAKLGVLSAADEAIINAIIPDDPLAFSPSKLVGQDPILSNLEKFRADKENDFQTRVATRTRDGLANYAANPPKAVAPEQETAGTPVFDDSKRARLAELRAKRNKGMAQR